MKKQVLISIKGAQSMGQIADTTDNIELVTQGYLYERDGVFFLSYEESPVTGLPDTKTLVRISDKLVSVTRTGKYPSNMLFEKGKQHMSVYGTDYGSFTVTVSTDLLTNNMTQVGGSVQVGYNLELDHAPVGRNNLSITAQPLSL